MTDLKTRKDWETLLESRRDDYQAVISSLEAEHWLSETSIGLLWDFCLKNVEHMQKKHLPINAGLETPHKNTFHVQENDDDSFLIVVKLWKKKTIISETIFTVDREHFSKVLTYFRRDDIQFGKGKGNKPEGKYNIYDKSGDAKRLEYTSLRNVLPMISFGIFEIGGKGWLDHVHKKTVQVGDALDKYVSFSGPGSSRNPSSTRGNKDAKKSPEAIEIEALLKLRSNVILEGVPGTGKTWIRDEVRKLMDAKMEVVTFHPASTYEEFVGGVFPFVDSDNEGSLLFKYQEGTLSKFANEAMSNKGTNFLLFIDEINRANIPLVMGELLTIIESTKRTSPGLGKKALKDKPSLNESGAWEVAVHVEGDDSTSKFLSLPSNLYILATMNTSDRSVVSMDAALRRRFAYYRIETKLTNAKPGELWEILGKTWWNSRKALFDEVFSILAKINDHLRIEVGPDAMLGHSYFFFSDEEVSELTEYEVIHEMMELNILPQLADTLTSMNKTSELDIELMNAYLHEFSLEMLGHELKAPSTGSTSLETAVTVCDRSPLSGALLKLIEEVKQEFERDEEIYRVSLSSTRDIKLPDFFPRYAYVRHIEQKKVILLAGSGLLPPAERAKKTDLKERSQMKNEKKISQFRDGFGLLSQDHECSTPTKAGRLVELRESFEGTQRWKNKNDEAIVGAYPDEPPP